MTKPWEDGRPLSVSDIALMAHDLWPVPEPFRLPPLSFYDTGEATKETKEIIMRELVRGVMRGESLEVVSARISQETKRQVDDYFRKLNNMLHHGTYDDQ